MRTLAAILVIAQRDVLKFLRDRARLISSLVFPLVLVGVLGASLQANLGAGAGYDFLTFTFTGVFAQTLFQSSALGVVSLILDRETDFSQEIFIAPVSRYAIIFGKILGESGVALVQGVGVVLFGVVLGAEVSIPRLLALLPVAVVICLFGGAFGIVILGNISSQRAAQQIFPFVMLPQFFLAGVFNPIQVLPLPLAIVSLLSPMRYAVDLVRGVYYAGSADAPLVVLASPVVNLAVMGAAFAVFLVLGTVLFVRTERNR